MNFVNSWLPYTAFKIVFSKLDINNMDVETQRLEREEKRRQRRERIRKILEDDPTRSTRDEIDSSRTTRTTAASRRPVENLSASTNSERTRKYT